MTLSEANAAIMAILSTLAEVGGTAPTGAVCVALLERWPNDDVSRLLRVGESGRLWARHGDELRITDHGRRLATSAGAR